jgi:hypothetical protein
MCPNYFDIIDVYGYGPCCSRSKQKRRRFDQNFCSGAIPVGHKFCVRERHQLKTVAQKNGCAPCKSAHTSRRAHDDPETQISSIDLYARRLSDLHSELARDAQEGHQRA